MRSVARDSRGDTAGRVTVPASPGALASALGVAAESLLAAGQERYDRQAYDSARAIWQVEVVRAQSLADLAAEARARMWLGLAAWRLTDYVGARREGEASLALKRHLGLDAELSRSFNALGLLAWNEGRYRDALRSFDSALASARRHNDAPGVARTYANIPLVQVELGEYDAARRGLLLARDAGRAVDDDRVQGNALANLAMLDIRLGNAAAAVPLLADARRSYVKTAYATGEANALGQLATAWSQLGDLTRALAAADSGLTLARATGLQQETAATLEVLADLHVQAGSPRLALRRLVEADSLDASLGLTEERGNNLRREAAILLDVDEVAPALARAREAVGVHRAIEARGEMIYDQLQLAQALGRAGDPHSARAEADSASTEATRMRNPLAVNEAGAMGAELALGGGDPRGALRYLSSASSTSSAFDWRLADLRAGAFFALGRLVEAQSEATRAVAALERERASLGFGPFRAGYFASRVGPFSRLVAIDLARGDTAEAFRVAASVPGRSLAERLGGATGAEPIASITAGERILLWVAALERELSSLRADRDAAERRPSVARTLDEARAAYEEYLAHRVVSPTDRLLGLAPITLKDVQSRLGANEALISFLAGPDRLDVFVVRAGRVVERSVAIGDQALAAQVRVARQLIAASSPAGEVPTALATLHDSLLGAVLASGVLNGASRWYIVPHGPLGALPFAALWNRKTGRFLIEDRVVTYLPSVGALSMAPSATRGPLRNLVVFAPLPDSLPGTLPEARAIKHLVPGAELVLGPASNESRVRKALEAGATVHLASHGAHNPQNPLFSYMNVGLARSATPENDGRLDVHEILGLRTASPLVFLSGCESGLGSAGQDPFDRGSDEGSLPQAFLIAGAGSVVATLWQVTDTGAAGVAERFYRHVRAALPPAEALAISQRELIAARAGLSWAAYAAWGTGARKFAGAVRATGTEP